MEKLKELYDMYQKSTGISWRKILENNEVSTKSPYYVLKKLGLKAKSNLDCQRKQELKEDFFEKINSEEKAYWLGFMFADGNVCRIVTGKQRNLDLLFFMKLQDKTNG